MLHYIVPEFEIADSRLAEETYPATLAAEEVPAYLSRQKAMAYADALEPDEVIITADTVVINEGRILGKPADRAEAEAMLRSLAGHTHTVVTGVTLMSEGGKRLDTFTEHTEVSFDDMSEADIAAYVERFKPYDKAGSYGIQEWIGAAFISGIKGCFYNVMGLPLHTLYRHLRRFFD